MELGGPRHRWSCTSFGLLSRNETVSAYFCILNMPAMPAREIAVLPAVNDEPVGEVGSAPEAVTGLPLET